MFVKPDRPVSKIYLHCSASDNIRHNNISVIRQWHLDRGWSDVGYHFFITRNGKIQDGRPLDKIPAAQKGHNTGSIAICVHGLKRFTKSQLDSVVSLCTEINDAYSGDVTFHGHCEVSEKTCPVFDYKHVLGLDAMGVMNNAMAIKSNINSEKDMRVIVLVALRNIHAVRVENNENLPAGFPDLSTSCGEIELKFIRKRPARSDSIVRCEHFNPKQREWVKRRNAAGGKTYVLLWMEGEWLLFTGPVGAKYLGHTVYEELKTYACWSSTETLPEGLIEYLHEANETFCKQCKRS